MKSKVIALSAISASFITLFLSVGAYIEVVDLIAVVVASAFIILPLCKKWYLGSFLAYLAGGILAFLISGLNYLSLVFPAYFLFFGIFPIIKKLMEEKSVKVWVFYLVSIIWSVLISIGLYFYYTLLMGMQVNFPIEWLNNYILPIVILIGVVVFFLYSHFLSVALKLSEKYIDKFINK